MAQFAFGVRAFGHQLWELGFTPSPELQPESSICLELMEMYYVQVGCDFKFMQSNSIHYLP